MDPDKAHSAHKDPTISKPRIIIKTRQMTKLQKEIFFFFAHTECFQFKLNKHLTNIIKNDFYYLCFI